MKDQFQVWNFDFPKKGRHPVVLISHPDVCARAQHVNVLYGTSQRQSRRPHPQEIMLNGADGMDWETFCDCSVMYVVEAAALFNLRGVVSLERRKALRAKLRDMFRLSATD